MTITLPIPLPTWNRLLAMNPWERKKTRDLIHLFTYASIHYDIDSVTSMEFQEKLHSTAWLLQTYFQMIRPKRSKVSPTPKKKYRRISQNRR